MNKILKILAKLSSKERSNAKEDIALIVARKLEGLDIKKLKGFDKLYRAKRGKVRIIFFMDQNITDIVKIDRRNDNTYNI